GPVTVGFTPATLEAALGAPEATGGHSRKHRRPVIWKYGDVEFHFDRSAGVLWLTHLDRFTGAGGHPQGWGELHSEAWNIREGLTEEAFIAAVKELGVVYTLRPEPQYNQEVVVLGSGVEVGFVSQQEPFSPPVGLAWLSRRYEAAEQGATADRA